MRWTAAGLLWMTAACNGLVNFGELTIVSDDAPDAGSDPDAASFDGGPEAGNSGSRSCDVTKPFGPPVIIESLNGASTSESSPTLTNDELTIFFTRYVGDVDSTILTASRKSIDDPFGTPSEVKELGGTLRSVSPTVTGDGLQLFWSEQKYREEGGEILVEAQTIMTVRRSTPDSKFGSPLPYRPFMEQGERQSAPRVARDGSELYFSRVEGNDIRHVYRSVPDTAGTYQAPTRVSELMTADTSEAAGALSSDGRTLYFARAVNGTFGAADVFTAQRKDRQSPFTDIKRADDLSSPSNDGATWISVDGCRMYMSSDRVVGGAIFVATKPAKKSL